MTATSSHDRQLFSTPVLRMECGGHDTITNSSSAIHSARSESNWSVEIYSTDWNAFCWPTTQNELDSASRLGSNPGFENRTRVVVWDRFEGGGGGGTVHWF